MVRLPVDRPSPGGLARPATRLAALSVALMLGACAQSDGINLGLGDKPEVSDIATASAGDRTTAELEKATAYWADEMRKRPQDGKAALSYAKNLKALGRKTQALSVLQASYMFAPEDREFLSEYGRLALEMGQVSTAGELLARADDPAKPDWRVTSARGTVLAKQGNFKDAIGLYERALTLAPGQASVMNNLAMAYTMDGQAEKGEELLRQARTAASGNNDPRIEQNLSLVRNLQGKPANEPPAQAPARPTPTAAAPTAAAPSTVKAAPLPPAQTSPVRTSAVPSAKAAAKTKSTDWDKPLPIEAAGSGGASSTPAKTRPITTSSTARPAPAVAKDPDEIVRAALAAEAAKRQ